MATAQEIWESNVDARVSMRVPGPRPGSERPLSVKGKGQRLRILPEDRVVVEEGIRDAQNNPFVNGKLTQVGGPTRTPPENVEGFETEQSMSDEEMATFFALTPDEFAQALPALSEANVRRLQTLFRDKGGTVAQLEVINDYVEEHWPITSGDTPSYREMRQGPTGAAL